MAATHPSRRLTKADRTTQLLDVAADLVLEAGPAAVTMERLAERAEVSKALVYLHFDNATEVQAAVFHREVDALGRAVRAATEGPATPEAKLRAAVRTYLDAVRRRGAILAVAASTASGRPADGGRVAPRFATDLFREIFDLPERPARLAASLFLGSLDGGVDAWTAREVRRSEVEEAAVSIGLHLAERARRS